MRKTVLCVVIGLILASNISCSPVVMGGISGGAVSALTGNTTCGDIVALGTEASLTFLSELTIKQETVKPTICGEAGDPYVCLGLDKLGINAWYLQQ